MFDHSSPSPAILVDTISANTPVTAKRSRNTFCIVYELAAEAADTHQPASEPQIVRALWEPPRRRIFALIRFTVAMSPESVSTFEKNLFGPVHNYLTTGHRPIHSLQGVQPQLWLQLLGNVIVPQVHRILPKERKVDIIGMTKMPISNPIALSEPAVTHWLAAFAELAKLFSEPKHLQSAQATVAGDPDEVLQTIDFEEQGTGYQAAYS
ncbi:CSE1_3 [Sanghuangporus weigelae]